MLTACKAIRESSLWHIPRFLGSGGEYYGLSAATARGVDDSFQLPDSEFSSKRMLREEYVPLLVLEHLPAPYIFADMLQTYAIEDEQVNLQPG